MTEKLNNNDKNDNQEDEFEGVVDILENQETKKYEKI